MTIDEFIAELKQSGIKFRRRQSPSKMLSQVRTADYVCPICALANLRVGRSEWTLEAWRANRIAGLGLSQRAIERITDAADGLDTSSPLRRQLLSLVAQ